MKGTIPNKISRRLLARLFVSRDDFLSHVDADIVRWTTYPPGTRGPDTTKEEARDVLLHCLPAQSC
jgi:hypothetical protein